MKQFVLQMAGMPGSGKSSLARAVGEATGAVVLDKDIIKSAALEAGVEEEIAGAMSYKAMFDLAANIVKTGHSVVIDSPAFFPQIVEDGRRIAEEHGAAYKVIECDCPLEIQEERLRTREAMPSQWTTVGTDDPYARPGTAPVALPHLVIDTTAPEPEWLQRALAYLEDHGS